MLKRLYLTKIGKQNSNNHCYFKNKDKSHIKQIKKMFEEEIIKK
jgi:hypothetical protein